MARDDSPPFGRGETFYNGSTIDSNNLGGVQHEGKIWVFEDLDYSQQGIKPPRSSRRVVCMCVRNTSGAALLPKRLVTLEATAADILGQVDGYANTTAEEKAYPVDEFLPAAGVPANDLFWIVIEGPAKVKLPLAGSEFPDDISVGARLMALTAATSGATTAGRVRLLPGFTITSQATDLSGLFEAALNFIGWAVSSHTSGGGTNDDLLVQVRSRL